MVGLIHRIDTAEERICTLEDICEGITQNGAKSTKEDVGSTGSGVQEEQ